MAEDFEERRSAELAAGDLLIHVVAVFHQLAEAMLESMLLVERGQPPIGVVVVGNLVHLGFDLGDEGL